MGVPISFLDKHCPEQFEILGITNGRAEFDEISHPIKRYVNPVQHNADGSTTHGGKVNTDAVIAVEKPSSVYYTADNQPSPVVKVYSRILVRHT